MEAARTSETSVDNYSTRQYIPEDNSELHTRRRENFKSHIFSLIPHILAISFVHKPEHLPCQNTKNFHYENYRRPIFTFAHIFTHIDTHKECIFVPLCTAVAVHITRVKIPENFNIKRIYYRQCIG
jgi:hypothetical protein